MKLVTGALGFIGSHYCKEPVCYIDNRTSNKVNSVKGYEYSDKNMQFEYIIHLAANAKITGDINYELLESNIAFTSKIFNTFKGSKILYASSAAIYEKNNMYSISKAHNEWLAKGFNATGFRFFNVYGERDNGIVGKILNAIKNDDVLSIYGGHQIRDFVSVKDIVRTLEEEQDSKEKIIEIGTGVGTSIYELIEMCEEVSGKKLKYKQEDRKEYEQLKSVCNNPISKYIKLKDGIQELWKTLEK